MLNKERIYKGICPKCKKVRTGSGGLNAPVKSGIELWCRECNKKFIPTEYEEKTYIDNQLSDSIIKEYNK